MRRDATPVTVKATLQETAKVEEDRGLDQEIDTEEEMEETAEEMAEEMATDQEEVDHQEETAMIEEEDHQGLPEVETTAYLTETTDSARIEETTATIGVIDLESTPEMIRLTSRTERDTTAEIEETNLLTMKDNRIIDHRVPAVSEATTGKKTLIQISNSTLLAKTLPDTILEITLKESLLTTEIMIRETPSIITKSTTKDQISNLLSEMKARFN